MGGLEIVAFLLGMKAVAQSAAAACRIHLGAAIAMDFGIDLIGPARAAVDIALVGLVIGSNALAWRWGAPALAGALGHDVS
jgi:hypothetical protein